METEHDNGKGGGNMLDNDDGKKGDTQQANKHSFRRAGSQQQSDTSDSEDSLADAKLPARGFGGRFRSRRQPVAEKASASLPKERRHVFCCSLGLGRDV